MATILVVDDEAHIRDVVRYALEREGHRVVTAGDGEEALTRVREGDVDLVVLDVVMPELDGLSVCRRIRAEHPLPIVFLSSRGEEVDRINGLELGGDDYVVKPFSPRELATRVMAVLRRTAGTPTATAHDVLEHGPLRLDPAAHEVRVGDTLVDLTATEFKLLHVLLEFRGRVLGRSELIEQVRDDAYHVTERMVDTHVRRIRAKLRPCGVDPIETVHGVGYKVPR
ncbi:MAG TPA: response regulator transcription factor [Candidatus Binatia bacterium]|jgi:two-component system OmpR family response regulator|nr:response regulator transcription factor [Candidatus Binatia bacterium]